MLTIAWLICGVYATIPAYWLAVHPVAHRWRKAKRKFSLLAPWWMLLWVVAWLTSAPWRYDAIYVNPWLWILSVAFWCVSAYMYASGGRGLSLSRVIGKVELEPDRHEHRLVTTGVHARVRHPLYFGHLCTMLGWSIGAGTVACWALTGFYLATAAIMIPMEERELRARFGREYDDYAQRVPAFLPRLF